MVTLRRLKQLLIYDPDTGLFVWRVSRGPNQAGDVAGTLIDNGYIHIGIDNKYYQASRLAWHSRFKKWQASIQVRGRRISLGYYSVFEEACAARLKASKEYFGEYARG